MIYIAAFLMIIGVSVAVHEFFHFYPAKKLGIKVLTFSIGMGKPILKWRGKDGVDYQIAMLPIGGYVKMLETDALTEEEKSNYTEDELSRAFNKQPVWKKLIVVLGGPLSNLVLALFIYALIGMYGVSYVKPVIGDVVQNEWAYSQGFQQGDEIISIDNQQVSNWQDIAMGLINNLGDEAIVEAKVVRGDDIVPLELDVLNFQVSRGMDLFKTLGIVPIELAVKPVIGGFAEASPAKEAGIEKGDMVVSVNGEPVSYWQDFSLLVHSMPNERVVLELERNGAVIQKEIVTTSTSVNGKDIGLIGVQVDYKGFDQKYIGTDKKSFFDSIGWGYEKMANMVIHSMHTIEKLVTGKVSVDNLSGPVGIAKISGDALQASWISFFMVMALINVSLGVLNLLPLPVLDGGHVVIYTLEGILGLFGLKLHQKSINMLQQASGMLLIGFMLYVIINDIVFIF